MKKISVIISPPDSRLNLENILDLMVAVSDLAKAVPSNDDVYNQLLGSFKNSPPINHVDGAVKLNLEEKITKGLGLKGTLQRANGSVYEGMSIPAVSAPGSVGTYGKKLIEQYSNNPDEIRIEYHKQFAEIIAEPAKDYWALILEFFSQRLDQLHARPKT